MVAFVEQWDKEPRILVLALLPGDVVAWNRGATVLYGDFGAMQGLECNMLSVLFLSPMMRRQLVDWPRLARGIVAKVRAIYARYMDDPWYHEIIDLLCAGSPEFAAWWRDHDVHPYQDGVKSFDHPEAGRLTFDFSTFDLRMSDSRTSVSSPTCRSRGPRRWRRCNAYWRSKLPAA